jgi:hypothetical protein
VPRVRSPVACATPESPTSPEAPPPPSRRVLTQGSDSPPPPRDRRAPRRWPHPGARAGSVMASVMAAVTDPRTASVTAPARLPSRPSPTRCTAPVTARGRPPSRLAHGSLHGLRHGSCTAFARLFTESPTRIRVGRLRPLGRQGGALVHANHMRERVDALGVAVGGVVASTASTRVSSLHRAPSLRCNERSSGGSARSLGARRRAPGPSRRVRRGRARSPDRALRRSRRRGGDRRRRCCSRRRGGRSPTLTWRRRAAPAVPPIAWTPD